MRLSINITVVIMVCALAHWVWAAAQKGPPSKSTNTTESQRECQHQDDAFHCVQFIKNYDGDTLTFDIPNTHPLIGKRINVRLRGLDTPEKKGKAACEKAASDRATRLVTARLKNAKRIDLKNVERDKYFRILASVEVDGEDLADLVMRSGLAYQYDGGTKVKVDWCERMKRSTASP